MSNTPRRVLMTADAVGGVWHYSLGLCRQLAAAGTEVVLATMGPLPSDAQCREALAIPGLRLETSPYRLEWMPEPWEDVDAAGRWLLKLEDEWQPDVVHSNSYSHGSLPWQSPCLVVAHSCVFSWWNAVNGWDPPSADWFEYHRRVSRGLEQADAVVAISRHMASRIAVHYGTYSATVIYNACEPLPAAARERQPVILTCGRAWDEGKNIALLDRIAPQLPWPVCVAGEVKHPGRRSEEPLRNLRKLGQLPSRKLRTWYERAPVYALPALYEPFGLSVLEAAMAECALVIADIPSLRELWEGAAVLIPPKEEDQWRETLIALSEDPERCGLLGQAARERALTFTPQRMFQQYLQVYSRMMADANSRREATFSCR